MKTAHVIQNALVVNSIVLDDATDPAAFNAVLGPEGVGIGWQFDGETFSPPPAPALSFDELRTDKLGAIAAAADALLALGAPVSGGHHIALDDGSRADLTAMATTASAAANGALPWPDSYSRGWITVENVRIPLPTPAAGLTLAASVGNWYAAVVQHRRDFKDAALAAQDAAALDAIDVSAGWPT